MRVTGRIAATALATLGSMAATSARDAPVPASAWQGHYRYDTAAENTSGAAGVRYDLTIGPGGERGCLLSSVSGDDVETIICHTSTGERTLTVAFHRFSDGRLVGKDGIAAYKPGQTLFTLERPEDGGPVATHWEALHAGDDAPASGRSFKRVD